MIDMIGVRSGLRPGKFRNLRNISFRTCLAWALLGMILLAGIYGSLDAQVSSAAQMEISNIPGGPTGDPSIDLSHGSVHTSFSLGGTVDGSSPAYNLKASYSSNVKGAVKAWLHSYQAGELGLGWAVEHPRIIRMNNGTGQEVDDRFVYYAAGHGIQTLKYLSTGGDFENYGFKDVYQPTTRIQRFTGDDDSYWVVTLPNGVKYYYGGQWGREDPTNYSDDFKQVCRHLQEDAPAEGRCQSGAIEYGVQWGDWVGASQNPKNQTNIPVVWNLSRIESITGHATILAYVNNIQDVGRQVGNLTPKAFSRSAYLYRVRQPSGAKTVIAYCPMADGSGDSGPTLENEAQPANYEPVNTVLNYDFYSDMCGAFPGVSYAEFADPHVESPEPDGYQERLKTVFIGGTVSFVAGNNRPTGQTVLMFDFLKGESAGADMAKRILTGVQRKTFSEEQDNMLSTTPPTLFTYWGQSRDDGVHVGDTDFSNIFNEENGAYYGAIKSITSSTGLTKTYTYQKLELDIARELEVPSDITSSRTALFSDGYILLVGADSDDIFTLDLVEWTSRGWEITYTYSGGEYPDTADGDLHPYDVHSLVTMQPAFFAFATAETDQIKIISKTQSSVWRNLDTIELPAIEDDPNVAIELRSDRETIFYLHTEPRQPLYPDSWKRHFVAGNYHVDSGETNGEFLELEVDGERGIQGDDEDNPYDEYEGYSLEDFLEVVTSGSIASIVETIIDWITGSGSDSNDDPMTLEEFTKYILETELERGRASAAIAVADGRVGLAVAETDIRVKSKVAIIDRKANTWSESRSANSSRNWCLANYGNGLYEGVEPTCAKMTNYGGFQARFDGNTLLATISGLSFDDRTVHGDKPQYFDLAVPFVLGPNLKIFGAGGKCLHVEDGNGANGTDIDLAGCGSSRDSVIWTYDDLSGEIRGMRSKCLDIEGGKLYENGAQIQIYGCHGMDNQKWRFDTESGQIQQGLLWGTHCIAIQGQPINGAKVVTQVCNDSQSQRWELVETAGYNLTPVYYDLRNVTIDRRGNMPYTVVNDPALDAWLTDDQTEFPFLLTAENDTELKLLDLDIKAIGLFNPARFPPYQDVTGIGSFIGEYWPYVWHTSEQWNEPWSWHADAPMKYAASAGFQASNGQMFHSSYLQARRMLADVRLGGNFLTRYEGNHASTRADVLTANCTYVAFDGSRLVDEPIYFNPYRLTGWLQRYDNHEGTRRWLSKRVYVNPEAAEIPDLGCVGAISLGGDALTTYNGTGRREYLALYPRLKRDGTSVMSRSLGDVSELGEQLTIDDIHRYATIARAEEKLKKIQTEGEVLNDINYALMGASMILDIITQNWIGLVQNILMSAIMVGLSEQMQIMAKMDQATIQNAVHKLGSVHQDANVSGSGFSLYNTALLYRETDGTVGFKGDIQDGIGDSLFGGSLGVVPERIKKYDLGSGVVTFQTRSTPYVRTLVNGTIGVASPVSTGNHPNMTAGEKNDAYALGLGRNFITYQKVGQNGEYTCRKLDKGRLSRFPLTKKYNDPCLFGARGKVFVHRMIDEAGVGNIESIVVDTVTFDDGLQATKVGYVFETASASHDRDNANYKKAAIHPGGRNGDNGRIVHYMYSGVENNVSLACERLNVETNAYADCRNDNGHGKVVSHVYRDHLRGQVYQRRVHEHGDSSPQLLTRTKHKIQVIERSGYPDAVRVLPVRTDRTRDNVTTVTNYHYNRYGQKTQTEVMFNNYDHAAGMVREEVINTSRVYAWETDAYGADFESANRYMDVVQTTLQRTMGDRTDGTRIVDANASSYTQVDIDGLGSPVYLPKRSYVYQASAGESATPEFNPSQPGSNWIALLETESYDSVTGAPTVTKNSQTGLASSVLLTESRPKVPYARFGNAIVKLLKASYTGFETYEDQDHVSNFTLANGAVKPYGFAGEQAYGANTGTVRVTVDRYAAAANDRPALLSAWVRPRNGQTCQLRIGDKSAGSQPGDGKTWQYLEVVAYVEGGDDFRVSCGSGGYIDEVLMRPVDSTFSSTAHDSHYRVTDTIGNNGIVTHLLRDHHNRVVASYGHDHTGKPRILGLPMAGFSRYNGFGSEPERPVLDHFTQSQPNHNATVAFQDENQTQIHPGSTAGRTLELEDSRRFALQAMVGDVIDITVEDIDGGEISLSTQTDPATLEKKFSLNQGGFSKLSGSVAAPRADQVLTWVVMDQFSAVFLDGKMLISTDGLSGRPDSGPSTVTFNLGRYSDVLVGHDPVLTRSFHDGFGRTIQTQSIGLDARDEPTRVKIAQVLYDGWGKPAVQTKLAMRRQPLGDYHTGYVSSFDWSNDRISGEIKDVFNGQGEGRPFTRTRYTDSPLLRPARQSLLPGNDFRLNGLRARTFSYGSTEQAEDDSLLGENDLYVVQNLLPFTDETRLETNVITDKAGRTVSTKLGNETQFGYIEWKYQYDYGTGNAFQTTTGFTPNYNAATVAGHQNFKNIATSWDNRSTVTTSQEPDLSGYALVVRDNLGRPRFMRKNVAGLTGTISGVSYISYDRPGRVRETGVLKNVSNTLGAYRTLANNLDFPSSSQTCWQKRYLYDTDLQTGNNQKFLTGRVFGLVANLNLIVDNPTNSCFDGENKGKSYIFYKYDQRGRVIGISEVTKTSVRNSAYQHNNLGARLAVTYPNIEKMTYDDRTDGFGNLSRARKRMLLFKSDSQMTVHYPRNLLGQLRAVCDSADCGGVMYASQYRYDVFGKVLSNRLNEDSLEQGRTYDFQERLTSLETEQDSTMVFSEKLSYEPYQGGNIREAQYTGTGLGGQEHSYQYKYDIWGRLSEAERFEGYNLDTRSRKYRYTYDHDGNMLTRIILGATDSDVLENHAYTYEPGKNQLNSTTDSVSGEVRYFSHNDHGAVTSFTNKSGNTNQYTLDSRDDRVYRVTNNDGFSAEYAYDPLNRRIGRISTGEPDIFPPYVSLLDLAGEDDTGASETDKITNQTGDLTITGCAEAGSTITLYQNGDPIDGPVSADISDGDCSGAGNRFTKDIELATDGVYEITAVAVDAAGNETASAALTIIIDSVTIAPAAVDNVLTIIGCAEAGSTITFYRNGELIEGTVLADNSDGACGGDERQFVKDMVLETGVYEITVVAEDPAGNRSPLSAALTISAANRALDLASEDDSGHSETDNLTNQTSDLTITGCATADSTITLYIDGDPIDGTVSADNSNVDCGDGSNQFTKDIYLETDGVYKITAVAVDDAGIGTAPATGLTITIDTFASPPAALDLEARDDTGDSETDNMTTQTSDLTITGCAEAGSEITFFRDGELIEGVVSADNSDGACSGGEGQFVKDIDLRTNSVYQITAVAEDPAGNQSPLSVALTIGVFQLPSAPEGLSANPSSDQAVLTWDHPGDTTITKYQYNDGGTVFVDIPGSDGDTTTYTVKHLVRGVLYTFAVRAVNPSGSSPASHVGAVTQ